jgi:fructoselysine-6-P-deglycase FrlB-like protein
MIEQIEKEIQNQPKFLKKYSSRSLEKANDGSIFVGAGDSLAASKVIYYLTGGKMLCFDSYTLVTRPEIAEGRDVYLVSVSGMTKSNVEAARRTSGIASRLIAVTSNLKSPLSVLCDTQIEIPYNTKYKLPGTLSFSLTLQTLAKIAGFEPSIDFYSLWEEANKTSLPKISEKGTTFLLGEDFLFPIALYLSFKIYEFFGKKSQPFPFEDFMHAAIFSANKEDIINVFCYRDTLKVSQKFYSKAKNSLSTVLLHINKKNPLESLFLLTFVSQKCIIETAKKYGIKEPYFLSQREKLEISNSIIY